jgi:hypothetical protein
MKLPWSAARAAGRLALSAVRKFNFTRAHFIIEEDLRKKRLLDVSGKHLHGGQAELVAARLRAAPHGPIADRLWRYIAEKVSMLAEAIG